MKTTMLLTGDRSGTSAEVFRSMQNAFIVAAVVFLLLAILLFIKFDLKNYFYILIKHNQKNVSNRLPSAPRPRSREMHTEQLLGEKTESLTEKTELLTEDHEEDIYINEEKLQFTMGTSVELYTEILNED